jgi:hypothetical protein
VHEPTAKIFSRALPRRHADVTDVDAPSRGASLDPHPAVRKIPTRFVNNPSVLFARYTVLTLIRRFQESIAGQAYLIEVAAVERDRWRANLVRTPGVPTALMPFYGPTPDQAADLLRQWLTRAHERAANPGGRV